MHISLVRDHIKQASNDFNDLFSLMRPLSSDTSSPGTYLDIPCWLTAEYTLHCKDFIGSKVKIDHTCLKKSKGGDLWYLELAVLRNPLEIHEMGDILGAL